MLATADLPLQDDELLLPARRALPAMREYLERGD
jgi:hypothetical protein